MRDGKVVNQGTTDQIISPEALREIYDMDINVHEIGGQRLSLFYN